MAGLNLVLVTGRSLSQGEGLDIGKTTKDYFEGVAIIELDGEDLEALGVVEGGKVKVETEYGSIVVRAIKSRRKHKGIAFMPMGPWASLVIDPNTYGSGMPTLKGIKARILPTDEKIPGIKEILERIYNIRVKEIPKETLSEGESVSTASRVIDNVACSFCGCLCDDLEVEVRNNRVVKVRKACSLGSSKLLHSRENRILNPYVRENGVLVRVDLRSAVKKAAEILANAKYPLLYGWSNTSVEAIRVGVELAEYIGGVFDNTSVICHGPTIQAVQEAGFVTSTLGKVKNYADLIIYWGCNPLNAHPRHLARYSAFAKGIYAKSRRDRKIVVIDVRETDTAKVADLFIKVKPNSDYELATALRMAIRGYDIESGKVAGVNVEKIRELAEMMVSAKFGVIFYGLGLTMTQGKGRNIEELIRLAQDLNEWTKFVAIPMRGHYNVVGANQVSTWTTGYAFSVDFRRGYPRYNPGVTSATDLLNNGDVDAALIVASDPVAHMPAKAVENLVKIPVVTLDPKWSLTAVASTVVIPVAMTGVEVGGTAYRMDKVPIRLKKLVEPPPGILSDEDVLRMILEEVKKLR